MKFSHAFATLAAAGVAAAQTATAPLLLSHQGGLRDAAGAPVQGSVALTFLVYDTPDRAIKLGKSAAKWWETRTVVLDAQGFYNVVLGDAVADGTAIPIDALAGDRWLAVEVGGDGEMTPRLRLTSVPYAIYALRVAEGGGTVSSVSAGPGLTGGPITAAGELAVDFAGDGGDFGTDTGVARGDHAHDARYLKSIGVTGAAALRGDVRLTAGDNVSLQQDGQTITVAAAAPAYLGGDGIDVGNGIIAAEYGGMGGDFGSATTLARSDHAHAAAAAAWTASGADLHNTNAGNVGIGTASPNGKLTVDFADQTWGLLFDRGGTRLGGIHANGGVLSITSSDTAGFPPLALQPAGGNVGIGTTTPGTRLAVAGGIQLGDDAGACDTAARAGTLRWRGSALEVCDGSGWREVGGPPLTPQRANLFYTGAEMSWVVPTRVTSLTVKLWGAGGGAGGGASYCGSGGGFTKGALSVTPGETLTLVVGQGGGTQGNHAGGGGGGTWIKRGATWLAAAGGGGGTGAQCVPSGVGGGATGGGGANTNGGSLAGGGTQSAGGAGGGAGSTGSLCETAAGTPGSLGQGGDATFCTGHSNTRAAFGGGGKGSSDDSLWSGGGGGGGYYGGGGAGAKNGGSSGGGGSGYIGGLTGAATSSGSSSATDGTGDVDYPGSKIGYGAEAGGQGRNGAIVLLYQAAASVIDGSTKLLLHCDDTAFPDAAGHATSVVGTVTRSTTSKFGGYAASLAGVGSYLTIASSGDFDLGSPSGTANDFTLEMWIKTAGVGGTRDGLMSRRGTGQSSPSLGGWFINLYNGKLAFGGSINSFWYDQGSSSAMIGTSDLRDNQWHHVAVVRSGETYLGFVDGGLQFSNTLTGALSNPAVDMAIGSNSNAGEIGYNGSIDEVRISKGIARWTAAFTPPTAPY